MIACHHSGACLCNNFERLCCHPFVRQHNLCYTISDEHVAAHHYAHSHSVILPLPEATFCGTTVKHYSTAQPSALYEVSPHMYAACRCTHHYHEFHDDGSTPAASVTASATNMLGSKTKYTLGRHHTVAISHAAYQALRNYCRAQGCVPDYTLLGFELGCFAKLPI